MTPLLAAPAGGGILAVKPTLLREPQNQACEPPKGMGDWWRGALRRGGGAGGGGGGGLAGSEAQTKKRVSESRN